MDTTVTLTRVFLFPERHKLFHRLLHPAFPIVETNRQDSLVSSRASSVLPPHLFLEQVPFPSRHDALPALHTLEPEPKTLRARNGRQIVHIRLPLHTAQTQTALLWRVEGVGQQEPGGVGCYVRSLERREYEDVSDLCRRIGDRGRHESHYARKVLRREVPGVWICCILPFVD